MWFQQHNGISYAPSLVRLQSCHLFILLHVMCIEPGYKPLIVSMIATSISAVWEMQTPTLTQIIGYISRFLLASSVIPRNKIYRYEISPNHSQLLDIHYTFICSVVSHLQYKICNLHDCFFIIMLQIGYNGLYTPINFMCHLKLLSLTNRNKAQYKIRLIQLFDPPNQPR